MNPHSLESSHFGSWKVCFYFMKHKGEVFQHFLNFKAMVEKEKGVSIICLRYDGGGE
jgi:hypothetical protein